MAGELPHGWKKTSDYSIGRGEFSICRISVMDERLWELWQGKECVFRGKAKDGAFKQALEMADKRGEKAA